MATRSSSCHGSEPPPRHGDREAKDTAVGFFYFDRRLGVRGARGRNERGLAVVDAREHAAHNLAEGLVRDGPGVERRKRLLERFVDVDHAQCGVDVPESERHPEVREAIDLLAAARARRRSRFCAGRWPRGHGCEGARPDRKTSQDARNDGGFHRAHSARNALPKRLQSRADHTGNGLRSRVRRHGRPPRRSTTPRMRAPRQREAARFVAKPLTPQGAASAPRRSFLRGGRSREFQAFLHAASRPVERSRGRDLSPARAASS